MRIPLDEVPFSYSGSYFALNILQDELVIRDIHGGDMNPATLFRVDINGERLVSKLRDYYLIEANELKVRCVDRCNEDAWLEMSFHNENTLYISTCNLTVNFVADKERYDTFYQVRDNLYEYISYKKDQRYTLYVTQGALNICAPWEKIGNSKINLSTNKQGNTSFSMVNYRVALLPEEISNKTQEEPNSFNDFYQNLVGTQYRDNEEAKLACYLLWSNQVHQAGMLTQRSLYMSKNWMQNIWSWDNCFAALALAKIDPELAYNQLKLFFDYQSPEGAFPDFINDQIISYSCVKPPIYGLIYPWLQAENTYFSDTDRLIEVYECLSKNSDFWLSYRKHSETGLIYYTHGNDSGWDNASIFCDEMPVSSPDLIAFLAIQAEFLAKTATKLGYAEEEYWQKQAKDLNDLLISTYFQKGFGFVAKNARTGSVIKNQESLILQMPLVNWKNLPDEIIYQVQKKLQDKFETRFGLATESPDSPLYQSDGYWLGPIWAPVSYLLLKSMKDAGLEKDYQRLRTKYLEMAKIGGMAENYDAFTGKGNDDLGFTWSSAVYLMLLTQGGKHE